ncbi:MAG: SDR family NAD(P)-dependent oxidoreductase [Beutenbergiaceae bacterium]
MSQQHGTVVVTGATRGIGRAICHRLAQDGWRVVATGRQQGDLEKVIDELAHPQLQHLARELDVLDVDRMRQVALDIARTTGLQAWVNNAGISAISRFLEVSPSSYGRTMDVNLRGTFFGTQAAAGAMIASGSPGSIVNIASLASQHAVAWLSDYSASKFGVMGLTQSAALELAEHQIRVNSVCPGFVDTDMQRREEAQLSRMTGQDQARLRQEVADQSPLGGLQPVAAVAAAVAFLLSDDASFITGEALAVNGGASMD